MDQFEMEQKLKDLDEMDKLAQVKRMRDFNAWQSQIMDDEAKKCAEELGLSQADFAKLTQDPAAMEKDLRRAVRKLYTRGASRVGKQAQSRKPAQPSERYERGQRMEASRGPIPKEEMDELKARAAKGQLSSEEEFSILSRLIGPMR